MSPARLVEHLEGQPCVMLLQTSLPGDQARYSFVVARPFLVFRSRAFCCEVRWRGGSHFKFGDPWRVLDELISRYELHDELDLPFPLGGCFGFWGYDLKNCLESRLPRRAHDDLEFPESHLGFYDSLVAFDHQLGSTWVIASGFEPDGSRSQTAARRQADFWLKNLQECASAVSDVSPPANSVSYYPHVEAVISNMLRDEFVERVQRVQDYIRSGDIYQANLSQRFSVPFAWPGWNLFQALDSVSPAPFSAFLDAGDFQVASSSPELFLRLSGSQIQTRPIKGTRPRSPDPTSDSQLSYQLQTSPKEMAELVMITDLMRNDLGKVCEFGSIQVPELARLERFAQVQHLVSTVEGILKKEVTHLAALAACFPGGSITGAPKLRAMEIIDELEPVRRGPYTGALGYIGFNRESQLSMIIRTALLKEGIAYFQTGAGIVADSQPEEEYLETLAKARGFLEALRFSTQQYDRISQRPLHP